MPPIIPSGSVMVREGFSSTITFSLYPEPSVVARQHTMSQFLF